MKTDSGNFFGTPHTRLGWWAAGLAVVFIVLFILISTSLILFSGFLTMVCGFIAGVVGLIAVVRQGERSWLVWLAVLCGLFVLLFALGESLVPH